MGKLNQITTGRTPDQIEQWDWNRVLYEGGSELIDRLVKVADKETTASLAKRKLIYVDRVKIKQLIQQQKDILSLACPWRLIVTNDDKINDLIQTGIDGKFQSLLDFAFDAVMESLVYGLTYIVVDRVKFEGDMSVLDADSMANPYAYTLPPDQITAIRYRTNMKSMIEAVITKSVESIGFDEYGFERGQSETRTLWTRDTIIKEDSEGAQIEIANPIDGLQVFEVSVPCSLIENLETEVQACNFLYSMATTGCSTAIFGAFLVYSDQKMKSLDVGNGTGVQLGAKDSAEILSTPTEPIKEAKETSNEIRDGIKASMRDKMDSINRTNLSQSGTSKKMDQMGQEAFSAYLAVKVGEVVSEVINILGKYMSPEKDIEFEFSSPASFVNTDNAEQRKKAKYLSESYIAQEKLTWIAQQKEIRKLSFEDEMTPEDIKQSNINLEEMAEIKFNVEEISDALPQASPDEGITTTGESL